MGFSKSNNSELSKQANSIEDMTMGFASTSAITAYYWFRYLNGNIPFAKHHLWMLNRSLFTSQIKERGRGLHRVYKEKSSANIEVRPGLQNEISIVYMLVF